MNPVFKAALWMVGAIVSFSAMAVAGRAVSSTHDTFEIMAFRSLTGLIIMGFVIQIKGLWPQITGQNLGQHLIRNIAHFTGQNLWFFALTVIPLAQVFALEFTSPLWVLILSPLILGEKLTKIRVAAALMGFVGILIVARPTPDNVNVGIVFAALSAICFALTILFTKRLTKNNSIANILFYLTLMQAVFGFVAAGYDAHITAPTQQTILWLILIGGAGLLAHFCMTKALSIAPATVVVPIDFTRLPLIAVVGLLFYDEPLDIWVLVGALIIFGGNYLNIRSETRKKPISV